MKTATVRTLAVNYGTSWLSIDDIKKMRARLALNGMGEDVFAKALRKQYGDEAKDMLNILSIEAAKDPDTRDYITSIAGMV